MGGHFRADRNDPLLNAALHCTGQSASRLDVPAMTLGEDCSDGKPTVWWPAVTGAERYEIWRAQAASDGSAPAASAYTLIVSADVTFHKDTTAEADTWYYYKVRAVSGSTYSDFSQAARRYCEAPPTMDTPEITSLELDDSGKPVLTWRTVEGAARYQVFRSEDNGFSYSPMGTVLPTGSDTITWTDTTAVSGTGYYYGVGCYDDNGHWRRRVVGYRPLTQAPHTQKENSGSRSPFAYAFFFYTYRWEPTSNTPRVVMRRLGITGSAMKLRVMNGSMPSDTPSA